MSRDTNPKSYDLLALAKLYAEEEEKISPDGEVLTFGETLDESEIEEEHAEMMEEAARIHDQLRLALIQSRDRIDAATHTIYSLHRKLEKQRITIAILSFGLAVITAWVVLT
jgi:hypothetical protein